MKFIAKKMMCILLLVVVITTGCSPSNDFFNKLDNENYESAYELYEQKIKNNPSEIEKLELEMEKRVDVIYDSFISKSMSFEEAIDSLDKLRLGRIKVDYIDDVKNQVKSIEESRQAYLKGKELIENNNYLEGYKMLERVSSIDKDNYNMAIQIMEENREELVEYIIKISSGKTIEEAISFLHINKKYDFADAIDDKIGLLIEENTLNIINDAKKIAEENDYESAVELLKKRRNNVQLDLIAIEIDRYEELITEMMSSRLNELKSKMNFNYDRVSQMTMVYPKGLFYSNNFVHGVNIDPRISIDKDKNVILLLSLGFKQSDWLFFNKITVAMDDDRITLDSSELNMFTTNRIVARWDLLAEWAMLVHYSGVDDHSELINGIINSEETIIRFHGSGTKDVTVSSTDKQRLKDIWELWNILYKYPELIDELLSDE